MSQSRLESAPSDVQSRPAGEPGGAHLGVNIFRDAWEYRVTDAGAERLAVRSGTSPAFLSILAIALPAPVTFAEVSRAMSHIDRDDLELWLSAMCTMGLLAPVDEAGEEPEAGTAVSVAGSVVLPTASAAEPDVAANAPQEPALPVVLLVHEETRVRANWRRALNNRGFALVECAQLEVVERMLRERKPAWVVLGLKGEDFDGLHLLRALKRPRAPRVSRVCLVVPRGRTLEGADGETAARADARAASVADIVRAVCGTDAVGEFAEEAGQAEQDAPALASSGEDAPAPLPAARVVRPPANAPVWMNLLYGDAFKYGSYETEHASELEAQYPRLMVRMIEGWSQPSFAAEIGNLLLDDRGDRHGFPAEVMEELWFLQQMHQAAHARDDQTDSRPAHSRANGALKQRERMVAGGRGGASTASLSAA